MIKTERNFHIAVLVVLAALIVGDAAATVTTTGDVRCLFVKCVVLKK
jgi:hypothetical protein